MRVLITGVSGTLGQAVTKELINRGNIGIVGYSRDELKQAQLPHKDKITLYVGDVRDQSRLVEASRDIDVIFHFAALKRVDTLEANPEEAYKTNILGTDNVLHAQRVNGIKRVVLSSTDKGAYPINVYGCTKQIAEALVLRNPANVVCRYGNVLASRGSVIPSFVDDVKNGNTVKITDIRMTRFFIRIEDAARFVVDSGLSFYSQFQHEQNFSESYADPKKTGGLKIPSMKGCRISDVAKAIGVILDKPVFFQDVGIRPGEKINECLRMAHEGIEVHSNTSDQFTEQELIDLLSPIVGAP